MRAWVCAMVLVVAGAVPAWAGAVPAWAGAVPAWAAQRPPTPAWAAQRPPPGIAVPCPGATADPSHYPGATAPYRCAGAVTDVFGNVVVLRVGRPEPHGFGLALAAEGNAGRAVVAQVVLTARPRPAPQRRVSYVAQVGTGPGAVDLWVEVDRAPSTAAPDAEPFGLLTAYCRQAGHPGARIRCPEAISGTVL